MENFIVYLLSFLAVFLFVHGIKAVFTRTAAPVAANDDPDDYAKPGLFNMFGSEVRAFGKLSEGFLNRAFPAQHKKIQNYLLMGAYDALLSVTDIRGMQVLAGVTLATLLSFVLFITTVDPMWTLAGFFLGAMVGWFYPFSWLQKNALKRQEEISHALPYSIDLLTTVMQAGQDFVPAVRYLVEQGPRGPLSHEFGITLHKMSFGGKSRVEALKSMAERIQLPDFGVLVSAVVQSTEMGSSITETLRLQAEEIRRARFHRAERKAARAPGMMMFPTALLILPAVGIVIFTPIVMRVTEAMP